MGHREAIVGVKAPSPLTFLLARPTLVSGEKGARTMKERNRFGMLFVLPLAVNLAGGALAATPPAARPAEDEPGSKMTVISDSTDSSSWLQWVLSFPLQERENYDSDIPPADCPPNCGGDLACHTGGPGTSSCTVTDHPPGMPGCSVTCRVGWYACCSSLPENSFCHCRKQ